MYENGGEFIARYYEKTETAFKKGFAKVIKIFLKKKKKKTVIWSRTI